MKDKPCEEYRRLQQGFEALRPAFLFNSKVYKEHFEKPVPDVIHRSLRQHFQGCETFAFPVKTVSTVDATKDGILIKCRGRSPNGPTLMNRSARGADPTMVNLAISKALMHFALPFHARERDDLALTDTDTDTLLHVV